jgi:hypothetical protein
MINDILENNKKTCPKGMIIRKSYTTKKTSKKNSIYVPETCIKDKGKLGHGPKILSNIDKNISLSSFGYKLSKSDKSRKTSLKKASKKYGKLNVLRRVNLIRNYSKSIPKNYEKLSNDVSYLKKEYSKDKLLRKSSNKLLRKSSNKLLRKSSNKLLRKSSNKLLRKSSIK